MKYDTKYEETYVKDTDTLEWKKWRFFELGSYRLCYFTSWQGAVKHRDLLIDKGPGKYIFQLRLDTWGKKWRRYRGY